MGCLKPVSTWSSSPRPCALFPCSHWKRDLEKPGPCNAAVSGTRLFPPHSWNRSGLLPQLQGLNQLCSLPWANPTSSRPAGFAFCSRSSSSCSLTPKPQRFQLLFDLGQGLISQVKNLTLYETLTSRACLFKMEFNHGDIFSSIPALFIIFFLIAQRGKFIKELGFNWLQGGRRDGETTRSSGGFVSPQKLLLSLD